MVDYEEAKRQTPFSDFVEPDPELEPEMEEYNKELILDHSKPLSDSQNEPFSWWNHFNVSEKIIEMYKHFTYPFLWAVNVKENPTFVSETVKYNFSIACAIYARFPY